ncbi:MAG: hypothetical protein IPK78_18300 [Rhodospirillales bacterium]|nr:hypothetical protein [Rhodospirillales bacterium]
MQYQRVKLALGADGAATDLAPGQGLMAASVPVAIASNQSAVPVSLATAPALVAGSATIGATMDAGPSWTSSYLHTASADASAGADVTAAPTTGQKIVIDDVIVSTGAALTVTFEEETSGTDVLKLYMAANGIAQVTPRGKIKLATADKKLRVLTSGAGAVACTIVYHSEA